MAILESGTAGDGIDHLIEDVRWIFEVTKTTTTLSVPLAGRQSDDQERRQSLRRLDDILETLEQLNLHDRTELTDHAAERLVMLGIREPHSIPIPKLIEHVWAMQLPYLLTIVVERIRRQGRPPGHEDYLETLFLSTTNRLLVERQDIA